MSAKASRVAPPAPGDRQLIVRRWSDEHERLMARLHQSTLAGVIRSYRDTQAQGAALEAMKRILREKLGAEVQRLLGDQDIVGLDKVQSTVESASDPAGWLRRAFDYQVRVRLQRLLQRTDAAGRAGLRQRFESLGGGNPLAVLYATVGESTPPMPTDAAAQELTELAEQLTVGQDAPARRVIVRNLAAWFRTNAIDQEQVRAFLASGHSAAYKRQVLGRIAVEFARAEFLLGWAYEGGFSQGGAWEEFGPTQNDPGGAHRNAGEFPTAYQDAVRTLGNDANYLPPGQPNTHGNYAEWCTSFVGFLLQHLGFRSLEDVGVNQRHSMFWSGTRLLRWARTGESIAGQMLSEEDNVLVDQPSSGLLQRAAFERLRVRLLNTEEAKRASSVNEFLTAEGPGPPEPGDVILHPGHTMMVESYDAATATIATIEGNKGQAVRSRSIVLADPADVAEMRALIRIGAEHFRGFGEEGGDGPDVDGEELVRSTASLTALLAERLQGLGFINAGAGAPTTAWQAGEGGGGVQ